MRRWPLLLFLLVATPTAATSRDTRDQLALEVAIVAAHEGALANVKDTALVWQVVEARAKTTRGRLAFLREHSGRALGLKPCTENNCVWSVELLKAPDSPPASQNAGWWLERRDQRWREVQTYASALVYGIETWRPCPVAPYSWGFAGDVEGAYRDRGLVPLGCEGVMNDGFAPAPKTIDAKAASGKR